MKAGNPTDGYKGVGTINAVAVYDDGVILTGDYTIESFVNGEIDFDKWDNWAKEKLERELIYENKVKKGKRDAKIKLGKPVPDELKKIDVAKRVKEKKHAGAHRFDPELNFDLDNYADFFKNNKHLPALLSVEDMLNNGKPSVGDYLKRLTETVEVQAIHIHQLNERLKALEQ